MKYYHRSITAAKKAITSVHFAAKFSSTCGLAGMALFEQRDLAEIQNNISMFVQPTVRPAALLIRNGFNLTKNNNNFQDLS